MAARLFEAGTFAAKCPQPPIISLAEALAAPEPRACRDILGRGTPGCARSIRFASK